MNTAVKQVAISDTGNALTPMDMLNRAVAQGADLDVLEKLMTLQERWEKSQARKQFDAAVANAKAEIPPIIRNVTGHNAKKYADFAAIAKVVDPILAKRGLAYRFRTTQAERITVTCILFGFGHSEENTLSGPADKTGNKNEIQAIGSTLTYLQRYSLVQALGLAAANDDDGYASSDDVISDEQATIIRGLVNETHANLDAFLKTMNALSIPDIRAKDFANAVAKLEIKKSRAGKT